MVEKVFKKIDINTVSLIILFFTFCEFIYAEYTGQRAVIALIFLCFAGVFLNGINNIDIVKNVSIKEFVKDFIKKFIANLKITEIDIICMFVAVCALLHTNNVESIRYFLLLIAIIFWGKFQYKCLDKFVEGIVILATILSIIQFILGVDRICGFFPSSPTQLACALLVCQMYLSIWLMNKGLSKVKTIMVFLCVILTFLTKTRSVFLVSVAMLFYYAFVIAIKKIDIPSKKKTFILLFVIIAVILLVAGKDIFNWISEKMNRSNGEDSNSTRMVLYQILIKEIFKNPLTFLVGQGGGFVEQRIQEYMSSTQYFPGHQDFLVILCEYGIIGSIAVFTTYLYKHKAFLYFLALFAVCSFHNIILTSSTMILMYIAMKDLEERNFALFIKNETN